MKHLLWAIPFAGLVFAPLAHADIYDDLQFVRDVDNAGITVASREHLINYGHIVCDSLNKGMDYDQIVWDSTGFSLQMGNQIASMAVSRICPDQWYRVVVSQLAFSPGDRIRI